MGKQNYDKFFGATDIGLTRQNNEDSFLIDPQSKLCIIADGMGGHKAGKTASRYAVKQISDYFSTQLIGIALQAPSEIGRWLVNCLKQTSEKIYQKSLADSDLSGMGTTVVMTFIVNNLIHLAHVGDSRAYLYSDNGLNLLTTDHSYVNYLVDSGNLDPEAARCSPFRSKLTQALGIPRLTKPDYGTYTLKENDILLLCSDGLWEMLPDDHIQNVLSQGGVLQNIVDTLINDAKQAGGIDNITVVIYRHCSE